VFAYKKDVTATEFLKLKKVRKILDNSLELVVGHCRYPTKGDEKFNINNHPFVDKSLVLVHQGTVWNDDLLAKQFGIKKKGETDSWIIIQLINHFLGQGNTLIRSIAKTNYCLRGSWACALIDKKQPDEIYLFCHENSITVFYLPEKNIYVFSTDRKKLEEVITEKKVYYGIFKSSQLPEIAEYTVEEDHCLLLNNEPRLWKLPEPLQWWNWKKNKGRQNNNLALVEIR